METETKEKPKDIPLEGEYLSISHEIDDEKPPENEASEPEIPTAELIQPIVGMVAGIFVPNWDLKEPEIKGLSEAYGSVLDKYFPDTGKLMGVELNALLITAAVVMPRIGTPAKKEPSKPDKTETQDETPSPPAENMNKKTKKSNKHVKRR